MANTTATRSSKAAKTSKSATANNEVVAQSANAPEQAAAKQPLTRRVKETRDQWQVVFDHTVALVVASARKADLPDDPRKGYAFGALKDQPNIRAYAQGLLAGFASPKAGKVFAQHEVLASAETRHEIAIAILLATKLGSTDRAKAESILSKAEKKQAKTLAQAVLAAL